MGHAGPHLVPLMNAPREQVFLTLVKHHVQTPLKFWFHMNCSREYDYVNEYPPKLQNMTSWTESGPQSSHIKDQINVFDVEYAQCWGEVVGWGPHKPAADKHPGGLITGCSAAVTGMFSSCTQVTHDIHSLTNCIMTGCSDGRRGEHTAVIYQRSHSLQITMFHCRHEDPCHCSSYLANMRTLGPFSVYDLRPRGKTISANNMRWDAFSEWLSPFSCDSQVSVRSNNNLLVTIFNASNDCIHCEASGLGVV